jgi:tRNA A58 N-methylase Trm61
MRGCGCSVRPSVTSLSGYCSHPNPPWLTHPQFVRPGDLAVDATAGNGQDAAALARLIGPAGTLHAFDIQEQAIQRTARWEGGQVMSTPRELSNQLQLMHHDTISLC